MDNIYAETCYQALYLINDRLGSEWEHTYQNNGQSIVLMVAEQHRRFDEVVVLVDDITVDGNYEKNHNKKLYPWDELPSEYVRMINKWYHVRTDDGVSHFRNYENIIAYADMVQSLLLRDYDLDISPHGEISITIPLRDRLTDYSRDVIMR